MTAKRTMMMAICAASLAGGAPGQISEKTASFQYFAGGVPGGAGVRVEGLAKAVGGKPFSAVEERETLQVLGDGTRIDKKDTDRFYRDAQGRTRTERDNSSIVTISDPVAGAVTDMNASGKVANKVLVMRRSTAGGGLPEKLAAEHMAALAGQVSGTGGTSGSAYAETRDFVYTKTESAGTADTNHEAIEDLGTQIVNGVPAQGSRTTITIPAGQIGNDREIRIVSERWFSNDLQVVIRSSNKDPRFGETTYSLTNIVQGAQDPALFQIPQDFRIRGLK